MKKLVLLLILAVSVMSMITSCEKDEITIDSSQQPIELTAQEVTAMPSNVAGASIAFDTIRGKEVQTRSTWYYLTGWTFNSSTGWYNMGYLSRSYLENYDVLAVISSSNHTGSIIKHGWSPFRWILGYYAYANINTTLVLTLEDLLSNETRGYFHTYSWTNNTTYRVDFYVRLRVGVDDYPYTGQSACHTNNNNSCDADDWNFCKDNCTSWVAWKVNQAQGVTQLGLGASNYPFYNQMTSPALSHAKNWDTRLASIGFTVNNTPQNGCIAQWEGNSSNGFNGHVAWVLSVSSDGTITVSEYNYSPSCEYNTRKISPTSSSYPDNFIHVL